MSLLGKKRTTFSRKEFTDKEYRRSGAFGSWAVANSTINALDVFAVSIDYDNVDEYLGEIKKELVTEPESG